MILGTADYMSPEQASGRPLDARSDIFSFGAVLYQLLARKQPFCGETDLDVLEAIAHATPDPLGPDIPLPLRMIVEKMLEKEVAKRYQSMVDVVRDLKRVPRQMSLPHASDQRTQTKAARRSYGGPVLVAGAVVLLVVASTILWQLRRADFFWQNPLAGARTERLTDFQGEEVDAAISPDGKLMAFLSDRDGPFDVWLNQIGSDNFRNVTKGKIPTTVPAVIRKLGFTGDGNHIWISEGEGSGPYTLLLAPVVGGDPRPFLAGAMEPAWSPDGTMLAYHTSEAGDPIFVADRSGRSPKRILAPEPPSHRHHLTWSPDGRFIYFVKGFPSTEEMDIWRIAAFPPGLAEPERVTTRNAMVSYLGWLDGRTLIYVGTRKMAPGNGFTHWMSNAVSRTG